MRKHVMAARIMKYIEDVNMATGEIVEIMPDGTIWRDRDQYLSFAEYRDGRHRLPDGWEDFLAIRKMVIPADSWRVYPRFKWVWIDKDYNIGSGTINDTSWRVSDDAYNTAYDGTIRALVGDLHNTGKLKPLMDYVYHHDISVYTTWSDKYELTIFHKGRKQWLSPGGWLGDKLLFMAAEAAGVPDGKFYIAKGAGKTLGQLIDNIESGSAYDEYWIHATADTMLGNVSERRKLLEMECAWDEIPQTDDMVIDTNTIELPDEILDLVSRFQKETGACKLASVVAKDAIHDGYAPTEAGVLDWIRDHEEWFADMGISSWYNRAIKWLTKPTDTEIAAEPCEWPELAYTVSEEVGDRTVTVWPDFWGYPDMIKVSSPDGTSYYGRWEYKAVYNGEKGCCGDMILNAIERGAIKPL